MKGFRRLILAWVVLVAGMALLRYMETTPGGNTDPETPAPTALHDPLGETFEPPPAGLIGTTAGLGFLLIGAWLTGRIFRHLGLPMITGYLVFGVLVGPELYESLIRIEAVQRVAPPAALVPGQTLEYLELVNALAISIIAFTAGGEIRLESLRSGAKHIVSITMAGVVTVFAGVVAVLMLTRPWIPMLREQEAVNVWIICAIIGTIAIANSPATVLAMIKETDADGPMAQIGLAVTVCKDLLLVIVFTILMAIALRVSPGIEGPTSAGTGEIVADLSRHLLGSILIGGVVGALFRLVIRRVADHMAIFVIAAGFGLALFSEALALEPLLVALSAGFVLANLWPRQSEEMFHATEELSLPVYCVFFAVAGAIIRIDALLSLWPLALFIVVLRGVLLWSSTWLGTAVTRMAGPARGWMWTSFVAQAGVSIALVTQVTHSFGDRDWGLQLSSLLLAIIAIHQLAGPPLMRLGLIRSGEVSEEE
ncbi:MAG: cation:proton antiporter [Phycisphaerales bacterium]|nr:MAG: cation:proton antiporter [Phycisphaerales bacterium]